MKNINQKIEHTNIKKSAKAKDIKKLCQEAKDFNFRSVCINPEWVKLASKELKQSKVKIVVLVDSPMGLSSFKKRLSICKKIRKDGGHEIDIVMNVIDLKYKKYDKVLQDLKAICSVLPTKVIIGSGYLTDEEIIIASKIVKKAGAFCVKTATELDPLENREMEEKAHHLKLMKKGAPGLKIKASGNIKTYDDARKMVKAGADIIGTSSGIKIIKDAK